MLPLVLAVALATLTLTAVTWITKRHAVPEDWETVTEILWWTIVGTWGYIAFGAAWESTWPVAVPRLVGLVPGVVLIAFGAWRLVVATLALGRPPRHQRVSTDALARGRRDQLTGFLLAIGGAGLAGRSGFGLTLFALFALIARVWVTRQAPDPARVASWETGR